ncbi:DUF4097 family beta strand repeat-containing protein [Cellulomonas sp. PhB143]|uniref:DUF4097 family beta strand repeat-containing protein n=1 Tax=Cellulomonas sp. PhB143 TaxID=2485186 RepID=UPI000F48C3DD|nr:DUF4097 family beta strand repeat-containing protein [Cellulomonas sp. PhB143]ROS74546.1 putative adhesin [Cellulomonas sp. PhB143]
MPTFPAPQPVPVLVDVPFANLHVVAGDRDDVVVTVLPTSSSRPGSVRAAEEVRVGRDGDAVTIACPGSWKQLVRPFAAGTADITVELPEGSEVRGRTGTLDVEGTLGVVEMTLSAGDACVGDAARLSLKVSAGSVVVGRVTGPVDVRAGAGAVRIAAVEGDATVRASNGTTTVGSVTGTLEVHGAHGDVVVDRVRGAVTAKTASGGVRVGRVERGTLTLTTSYGSIEVGVPEGTAAWLDVASQHGSVRNRLAPAAGPGQDEDTAEIHATTGYGDVVVRRP